MTKLFLDASRQSSRRGPPRMLNFAVPGAARKSVGGRMRPAGRHFDIAGIDEPLLMYDLIVGQKNNFLS